MARRRRKSTKGQLSIETLLIYGTVLLVATLAISALVYFGVLDLGGLLPDKCQIGSELVCENYVGSGTTMQLELRDQIGKNIQLVDVSITGEDDWAGTNFASPSSPSVPAIATLTPLAVNSGALSEVITVTSANPVSAGQKYKGRITVTYTVIGSSIEQTKTGTILATFS